MVTHTRIAGLMLISCLGLLVTALYMEHVTGLVPCALCLAQRVAFGLIGAFAACYLLLHSARTLSIWGAMLGSCLGIWLAGRQLWLQSLPPDQVPDCGPDIYFMLDRFPLGESIKTMLLGSGSCAEVQWTWLGLSIPGWTALWFALMLVASAGLMVTRPARTFTLFKR